MEDPFYSFDFPRRHSEDVSQTQTLFKGSGADIPFAENVEESSGGGAAPTHPLQLYNASTSPAALKIGIRPGLVNNISPTFTDASPAGTLADDPPPLLTITATTHFWLKVVGTFGTGGAADTYVVTIETTATGTAPGSDTLTGTGFTLHRYLGYVTVSGGAITTIFPSPAAKNNTLIAAAGLGIYEF